jgi:hypothetical protein
MTTEAVWVVIGLQQFFEPLDVYPGLFEYVRESGTLDGAVRGDSQLEYIVATPLLSPGVTAALPYHCPSIPL